MRDAKDLVAHWQDEPPVAWCIRAYLGVKPAAEHELEPIAAPSPREVTPEEFERLVAQVGAFAEKHGRIAR